MAICLVLGLSTALYRLFKHCTLTNKAVGSKWRAFSKPLQMLHGIGPSPKIVSRDSFSLSTWACLQISSAVYFSGCRFIFLIYYIFLTYYRCMFVLGFYYGSAWKGCSPLVPYKEDFLQFFKCVALSLHNCCRELEYWAQFTTSVGLYFYNWMESVCNRCVIEFLVAFCVVALLFIKFLFLQVSSLFTPSLH